MATTATAAWTTYAILTPTKPAFNKKGEPIEWKVQTNEAGQWRCYCPSFIFSKTSPRSCKHIRRCQQEMAQEGQPVPQEVQAPVTPTVQHPQWASAVTICSAMLDEARVHITPTQLHAMTQVLAAKLAAFVPTPVVRRAQAMGAGVRMITFDD